MHTPRSALIAVAALAWGCSHTLTLPSHSGWTVRYAEHVGEGPDLPRTPRATLVMALLDGRARLNLDDRPVVARIDHAAHRAELCRAARCEPAPYTDALAAVSSAGDLHAVEGAVEPDPTVVALTDDEVVAGLHTAGARFTGALRSPTTRVTFTVEVRWIVQPGDASVEAAKDYFLAPLVRLGAVRLADAIRRTAGLPLYWDVRIASDRSDGTTAEGADVLRAAEVGNAPAGL